MSQPRISKCDPHKLKKKVFSSVTFQSDAGHFIIEVSGSHIGTHTHIRQDSHEQVISFSQRPLPTQHTTDMHALCLIRTGESSNQELATLSLKPRGNRDQKI